MKFAVKYFAWYGIIEGTKKCYNEEEKFKLLIIKSVITDTVPVAPTMIALKF